MLWFYNKQSSGFNLKVQSYLFELLYKLFTYFPETSSNLEDLKSIKHFDRLSNIINYLHANYDQEIMLQDLAEKEFLSVPYISRFFKKYIGTSFKEYIIRIRLEHAVKDLLYTDKSILRLSLDNGFPNTKSFLDAFKENYNVTPSLYRKTPSLITNFCMAQPGHLIIILKFPILICFRVYINFLVITQIKLKVTRFQTHWYLIVWKLT